MRTAQNFLLLLFFIAFILTWCLIQRWQLARIDEGLAEATTTLERIEIYSKEVPHI